MRILSFIIISLLVSATADSQTITFSSEAIGAAVKEHIGLSESESVRQNQTDTITKIDFSRLDIYDISDVVNLPAVQSIDLSNNHVKDLTPLLSLKSLRMLNLSNNDLENIDVLTFTSASEMIVDVSRNHISDFSFFFNPMACTFTLIGMDLQTEKDATFLNVCELYTFIDHDGSPMVSYRGYTNSKTPVNLKCGAANTSATIDGSTHIITVPGSPQAVSQVSLTSGDLSEATFIIPTASLKAEYGKTVTWSTGLPDDYMITTAYAKYGRAEAAGTDIKYAATNPILPDTIYFAYYQGSKLRGFTRYFVNTDAPLSNFDNMKGDANCDKKVDSKDVVAVVNYIMSIQNPIFSINNANVNGDKVINAADIVEITNIILGHGSVP